MSYREYLYQILFQDHTHDFNPFHFVEENNENYNNEIKNLNKRRRSIETDSSTPDTDEPLRVKTKINYDEYDDICKKIRESPFTFAFASEAIRNDPKVASIAVVYNGMMLQFAGPDCQNDPEVVKLAVRNNGLSFQFASENIRSNYDIALSAVLQNWRAFNFCTGRLKNNKMLHMSVEILSGHKI
jgi:hypothetical protein